MKRNIRIILAITTVLFMCLALVACGSVNTSTKAGLVESEWVTEDVEGDETACTIKKYNGYATNVVIPDSCEGKIVVGIGDGAFMNNRTMMAVSVPDTITEIGVGAFDGCTYMRSFHIGAFIRTIGEGAFANCTDIRTFTIDKRNEWYAVENNCILEKETKKLLATCKFSKMPSSDSYTSIASFAFAGSPLLTAVKSAYSDPAVNKNGLVEVVIPDTVTEIGRCAFTNCPKLTEAVLPKTLKKIGKDLFWNAPLKKVTLYKNALKSLDKDKIESVTLLGATEITKDDFREYTALKTLVLPDTVTKIAEGAFYGCSSLSSVTLPFVGGVKNADETNESCLFGYVFGKSSYDKAIGITQTIQKSGNEKTFAQYYIPQTLKRVTILGGNVRDGAFYNCKYLETVSLNVRKVGEYAFTYCESLKTVEFTSELEEVGIQAFYMCKNISQVKVNAKEETKEEEKYDECVSAWCNVTFGNNYSNPLTYGKKWYVENEEIGTLVIPETVKEIKSYAFYNAESLKNLTLPATVTQIGTNAFYGCTGLGKIENRSALVVSVK